MARRSFIAGAVAALSGASGVALAQPSPHPLAGGWALTGAIDNARSDQAATLLADGRVLVCGGQVPRAASFKPLSSCEVWSPETERWTPAGSLPYPRAFVASARLADGRVALIGGKDDLDPGVGPEAQSAVDVWDPRRNDAETAGLLPFRAEQPHAARLPDGRLFILDDGPEGERPRAAVWNASDGTSKDEPAPIGAGRTVALLVGGEGTLTVVRRAPDCHQVSIWRRAPGRPWIEAHVEATRGCAAGGSLLDDHRVFFWSRSDPAARLSTAAVWDASPVNRPPCGRRTPRTRSSSFHSRRTDCCRSGGTRRMSLLPKPGGDRAVGVARTRVAPRSRRCPTAVS